MRYIDKYFKYILAILFPFLLAACSEEEPELTGSGADESGITVEGDYITLSGSVGIATFTQVETRTLRESPELPDLHLYLVEFTDEGNPLVNTYIRTYEAEQEMLDNGNIKFNLTLRATTQPRILHLIALPKSQQLNVSNGIEASVMPSLTVTDGAEAYWRRLSFPNGYCSEAGGGKWQPDEEMIKKLTGVKLIRNYSKISMKSVATDFELLGFEVLNTPGKGSMVAWNPKTRSFPDFYDGTGNLKDFKTLLNEYEGYLPANTPILNQSAGPAAPVDFSLADRYFYERPLDPQRRTFIIIKGKYKGVENYYKIDIGKNDDNGMFQYYHLLRNFNYLVNIKSVNASGYLTAADAAEGTVYNNISFDIDLSHLMNMSDGKEIIYVSYTTKVLTNPEPETIDFAFRYVDMSTGSNNNNGYRILGLEPGSVIQSVGSNVGGVDEFRHIDMVIRGATDETKIQTFAVVKPQTGLGRSITLILHSKWDFENMRTYPEYGKSWGNATDINTVPDQQKGEFTLFFDIPANISESVFPIDFVIESEEQVIENDPGVGMMEVNSGESLFTPGKTRIQFHRHLTWTQYTTMLEVDANNIGNGGVMIEKNGEKIYRVYCHFRNTMALDKNKTYHIAVDNVNFNKQEIAVRVKQ